MKQKYSPESVNVLGSVRIVLDEVEHIRIVSVEKTNVVVTS